MVTFPVRVPVWVGVKVTAILQVFPTASVEPHGFGLVAKAKSPLDVMPLMFRIAFPVFLTVIFFDALVTPTAFFGNVSEVGVRVTIGPLPAVTVSEIVVVCVSAPDVPVTVTVEVPLVAVALAVKVNVLVVLVGFGLNTAVTPLGRPEAFKLTLPLKPFTGTTVMVLGLVPPWATLTELGLAVRPKSAVAATLTVTGAEAIPLATTLKVYCPLIMPVGISNRVVTAVPGAIEWVVSSCVVA